MQDHQIRAKLHPKQTVRIKVKTNGEYMKEATGRIAEILTKTDVHPRGCKVRLEDGTIGRVTEIIKVSKNHSEE